MMRILLLTHAFNSLTQRLGAALQGCGHEISIEFDIADSVAEEAVALFKPDLIIAPYLRRAIPESIWKSHVCLIVHPGIVGDRGPSALDWALQEGEAEWGVTVLQAEAEMDAGPVWATASFPLRAAKKSSIYRNEVTQAAVTAVLQAVERYAANELPTPLADMARGARPPAAADETGRARDRLAARRQRYRAAQDQRRRRFPRRRRQPVRHSLPYLRCLAGSQPRRYRGPDRGRGHRAARDGALAAHLRRRGVDRPRQARGRFQAAGDTGVCRAGGGSARSPLGGMVARRSRDLAGHRLGGSRWRRRPAFRVLQRRDVHQPMPTPARSPGLGQDPPGARDRARRRRRLLVQWHPPQRDRSGEPQ
jgi:hypothetical protein